MATDSDSNKVDIIVIIVIIIIIIIIILIIIPIIIVIRLYSNQDPIYWRKYTYTKRNIHDIDNDNCV